jgi:predicted RecB family nuclease
MIITASTLRNLAECARRVWLDAHGDANLRSPLSADVRRRLAHGILHEDMIQEAMIGPADVLPTLSWPDALRQTLDLMGQGVQAIRGAVFERELDGVTVRGQVDWLIRTSEASNFGRWAYQPVEVKSYADVTEADTLQLDLYLWLVAEAQGAETSGWLWMGQDATGRPRHQIEHHLRADVLFAALERLRDIQAAAAPGVFLASHCDHCQWLAACTEKARQEHSFTLLPTLKRQTRQHLWDSGIRTYDEIAAMPLAELQKFYGIGKVNAHDIMALANAFMNDGPVWRKPFPDELRLPGVMFDLETNLNTGAPWCFGWKVDGEPVRIAVVDRYCEEGLLKLPGGLEIIIVENSDEGWERLAEDALKVPGSIFHWTDFDKAVMRKFAPRYVVEALDDRMHDLHKTYKATVTLPISSTSIKTVGAHLGYAWPHGSDAFGAWDDYNRWLLDGEKYALARACAYQYADVEALDIVWRWLVKGG